MIAKQLRSTNRTEKKGRPAAPFLHLDASYDSVLGIPIIPIQGVRVCSTPDYGLENLLKPLKDILAIQRAIRRALFCVSSETVGGPSATVLTTQDRQAFMGHNSCPRWEMNKRIPEAWRFQGRFAKDP